MIPEVDLIDSTDSRFRLLMDWSLMGKKQLAWQVWETYTRLSMRMFRECCYHASILNGGIQRFEPLIPHSLVVVRYVVP